MTKSRLIGSLFTAAVAASALFLGSADGALAHHHYRHHGDGWASGSGDGPFGTGPVHGPGSSHNPIIYHPAQSKTVVRDHRRPVPRPSHLTYREIMCRKGHLSYCSPDRIRDHRTPPGTQCYGDLC